MKMKAKPIWMVRAEVGGKYFEDFKAKSIVAIGWVGLGDMALHAKGSHPGLQTESSE